MNTFKTFSLVLLMATSLLATASLPPNGLSYKYIIGNYYYDVYGGYASLVYVNSSASIPSFYTPSSITTPNGTNYIVKVCNLSVFFQVEEIGDGYRQHNFEANGTVKKAYIGEYLETCGPGLSAFPNLEEISVSPNNDKYDSRSECNAVIETATNKLVAGCKTTIIPNSITSIGNYAFSLGQVAPDIPNSVTSIGQYAFEENKMESISIPSSVTTVGRGAFNYCPNLQTVYWNAKNCQDFKNAEEAPLIGDSSLDAVLFGDEVESIPAFICTGTRLGWVDVPNSVKNIGAGAFQNCTELRNVSLGNNVETIGTNAFAGCTALTEITLPESLTTIADGAFSGCTELKSIVIPNSVTSIGKNAFEGCENLTTVTIGESVETIGKDPFLGCRKIATVYWNAKNCQDFSTTNTPPFDDINFIGNIWINFGDKVERIPAFLCNNLTRTTSYITIPNSVKTIGQRAFYFCKNVKNVRIGDSVTKIEQFAFLGCSILEEITIGKSVETIESAVFSSCPKINKVTNYSFEPQTISASVFNNVTFSNCLLYVPKVSVDKYKAAEVWKKFKIQGFVGVDGVQVDKSDAEIAEIYNLQGQRMESLQNGINIVRYTDGSISKIVVK